MTGTQKIYILAAGLLLACGLVVCLGIFGPGVFRLLTSDATPVPDYEATLQVVIPEATASGSAAAVDVAPLATEPTGHIVFTCQIYRDQSSEQICIMNADGTAPVFCQSLPFRNCQNPQSSCLRMFEKPGKRSQLGFQSLKCVGGISYQFPNILRVAADNGHDETCEV